MQIRTADGRFEYRATTANPAQQWGSTAPPPNGMNGMVSSGVQIRTETALQLAAVWGSTALISDSIATLPLKQWKLVGGEPVQMDPAQVIAEPCAEMTQRDFVTQGTMSYLLAGNIFGQVASFTDMMLPEQVQLFDADRVNVRRNMDTGAIEVRFQNQLIPDDVVIRSMGLSRAGGIKGLNPIAYMREVMGLARAQDLMSGAFFANSARPDGVLQVKGPLDINEAKAMKQSWLESFQGINHAYLPAVLTQDTEYKPITMSMADAQFLEQMQFSASVISGMIYRVPPHMLGMVDKDTSWGAGIEQQETGFVRNTLLIWLARWEDLLTSWLPRRQFVTFDLSQRLRGDALQRWSGYQIARVIGAMNNAEIRQAEGLSVVTDPVSQAILEAYDAPLNSAPVKPTATGGAGGDKSD